MQTSTTGQPVQARGEGLLHYLSVCLVPLKHLQNTVEKTMRFLGLGGVPKILGDHFHKLGTRVGLMLGQCFYHGRAQQPPFGGCIGESLFNHLLGKAFKARS